MTPVSRYHLLINIHLDSQQRRITILKNKKNFKFDRVFDTSSNQNDVFDGLKISQLVSRVVDGYHATIFAYGQTGSGKTFTMEGYDYKSKSDGKSKSKVPIIKDNEHVGITQRAIKELFQQIKHK